MHLHVLKIDSEESEKSEAECFPSLMLLNNIEISWKDIKKTYVDMIHTEHSNRG